MNKKARKLGTSTRYMHTVLLKRRYSLIRLLLITSILGFSAGFVLTVRVLSSTAQAVAPAVLVQPEPTSTPESAPAQPAYTTIATGTASYYSEAGCLGCSPGLIMHNGEPFQDENITLSLTPDLYRKYKNQYVLVTNTTNGQSVLAKVTDSGGFARYNRVADLSPATKQAINCSDLCKVSIVVKN